VRTGLEHRIANLAVYVELELRGNCIANADRSRALESRLFTKGYSNLLI